MLGHGIMQNLFRYNLLTRAQFEHLFSVFGTVDQYHFNSLPGYKLYFSSNLAFCFYLQWVNDIGGYEKLGEKLLKGRKDGKLPIFIPPKVFYFFHHCNLHCLAYRKPSWLVAPWHNNTTRLSIAENHHMLSETFLKEPSPC